MPENPFFEKVVTMPTLKFSVQARRENDTKTIVETRGFRMVIDEPEDLGGTNSGANPVEYMLAACSGCLNVVGHVIAREMGINLKGLEISMEGDLNPDRFLGNPTQDRAGYQEIRVTLKPDTEADQAMKEKWLTAVRSRCPVSDNIAHPTPISISLG